MPLKKVSAVSVFYQNIAVLICIALGIGFFIFSEIGYFLLAVYKYGVFGDAAKPVPNLQPLIIGVSILIALGPLIALLMNRFVKK